MKKVLSIVLLALFTLGAAAQNYSYGIDEKKDEKAFDAFRKKLRSIHRSRPTVALVLSGGGAKGAAHIGIIKALEEEGIPVDLVLGTSIGGLIGGLYACGYSADELETIMRSMDWDYMLGDTHPRKYDSMAKKEYNDTYEISFPFGSNSKEFSSREHRTEETIQRLLPDGVVYGQNVRNMLSSLLVGYEDERDFLTLPRPFICIAAEMVTARTKIWHSGRLADAMRSTMSIPGLFTPVKKDGMVLIDGGMMDNYPAELASRLGIDIIIGVDISTPAYSAEEINSLLDIVYQALDVMGRDAYNAGKKATSVYIHPDISGYGMMSFDSESINGLIASGKRAAKESEDAIKDVKKKLRGSKIKPIENKAVSITTTPIRINKIDFSGVSLRDRIYLRRMLNIGDIVSKEDLDNAVYTLLGTTAFDYVTYDILGEHEPYDVTFRCRMAPVNQVGVSARFDNHEYASLMFNAGFNARRLTGSRVDLTGRLGLKSFLEAKYTYRTNAAFDFGASAMVKSANNGRYFVNPYEFEMNYFQARVKFFAGAVRWNTFSVEAGTLLDYFKTNSILVDSEMLKNNVPFNPPAESNLYPIVYLKFKSDTYDNRWFPTRGVRYGLEGNYHFPGLLAASPSAFSVQGTFKAAVSFGRFSMLPSVDFRFYSGSSAPYINYMSVAVAGRTMDQQIPFIGLGSAVACESNTLAIAGLDFRYRILDKHYISLRGQYGRASNLNQFFTNAADNMYGVALEYAYDFLTGPIKVDVHWSNVTRKPGVYISLGYDF